MLVNMSMIILVKTSQQELLFSRFFINKNSNSATLVAVDRV